MKREAITNHFEKLKEQGWTIWEADGGPMIDNPLRFWEHHSAGGKVDMGKPPRIINGRFVSPITYHGVEIGLGENGEG